MNRLKRAVLPHRGVVSVTGEDAAKLLQGLITNDMERLDTGPAIFAGLLSPQGKILFEFFVVKAADGFLLETAKAGIPDLVKRLTFYRLRAKAEISDVSDRYKVLALWDGEEPRPQDGIVYADPRLAALGARAIAPASADLGEGGWASEADYDAHRISLGVPEGGRDYALADAFPHEALFDQLNGVDFAKGCYVGQEIVSRMEHRGTARKRVVPIAGAAPPQSGQPITAGSATIGTVGSVAGHRALALLRIDRAAEAEAKGDVIAAGNVAVRLELPEWAHFEIGRKREAADA